MSAECEVRSAELSFAAIWLAPCHAPGIAITPHSALRTPHS